jgi:hypothetical protein
MRGAGQPRRASCDQTSLRRELLALAMLACAARAEAFLYWTNFDTGTIGRATVVGTNVDQSFVTGASAEDVARTERRQSPSGSKLAHG